MHFHDDSPASSLEWNRLLRRIRYLHRGTRVGPENIKIMRAECFGSIRRHRFLSATPSASPPTMGSPLAAMQIYRERGWKKLRQSAKRSERGGRTTRARYVCCTRVRARARVHVDACERGTRGPPYVEWVTSNGRGCGIFRSVCK